MSKTKLVDSKEIQYKKFPAIIKMYSNQENIFLIEIIDINNSELRFRFETFSKAYNFYEKIRSI